jgi:hypothetical protein
MRYEAKTTIAMSAIVLLATVGFIGLRDAMKPPMRAFPLQESTDSFAVRAPEFIRPDSATYAPFATADAQWRARYASPVLYREAAGRVTASSEGGLWRPSARQLVDDRVYALSKAGRLDSAITVLTEWVNRNPRDRVELLKLARLLNQAGRGNDSVVRYRQLLALETTRSQ